MKISSLILQQNRCPRARQYKLNSFFVSHVRSIFTALLNRWDIPESYASPDIAAINHQSLRETIDEWR